MEFRFLISFTPGASTQSLFYFFVGATVAPPFFFNFYLLWPFIIVLKCLFYLKYYTYTNSNSFV